MRGKDYTDQGQPWQSVFLFWWSVDPAFCGCFLQFVLLHSEFPGGWGYSSVVQTMPWVPSATPENGGRREGEGG